MRRGWLARVGDEFMLAGAAASRHLRLTVHDLDDADAERLVTDLVAARTVAAAGAAPSASDPRSPESRANPS